MKMMTKTEFIWVGVSKPTYGYKQNHDRSLKTLKAFEFL